ncbi:hypothetical protein WS105_1270 [Weissella ceti]|uniref:Uncharacterized protein n=3 Tax=Lactobacillaceae TaxID=33958 RepID=A0A075U1U4_9LACO|nr:hypothetical protein WS08_1205 [Weissella tructae]AIM63525.1 hypothetical protein WS74_1276 [Weissella ceti]AIM64860.1 hypothetical protein WS105_1270 [Weissella ceti]ELA07517.1 hypothetical protein WCNC_03637 [Weissella ceti NC36]
MRMIVMNHVQKMRNITEFVQQARIMAVDAILILSAEQSVQSGTPDTVYNVVLADDGISRLYRDNPALLIHQVLCNTSQTWQLGWATQMLTPTAHRGVGLLVQHETIKLWRRIINANIQIQVMDMGQYVVGIIVVKDTRLVRRAMLQRVHDLLKAQVKPVLLFGPPVFANDLLAWGWLARHEFTQQTLTKAWDWEVWCDCADEVGVLQTYRLPEGREGLIIDFK